VTAALRLAKAVLDRGRSAHANGVTRKCRPQGMLGMLVVRALPRHKM
jgi:hypothetical protein